MTDEDRGRLAAEAGRVFTPAAPIDRKSLFAGRTGELRAVLDAVNQRGQHAILYGERGVGKTSLANVLPGFLETCGVRLVAPHVNCDQSDTYASLWTKVFREICFAGRTQRIGFGAEAAPTIVSLAESMPPDVSSGLVMNALRDLAGDITPVVIIDELDRLVDPLVRALLADTIKMLSDRAVPATLVLVGVADTVDQLIQDHRSVERALVQVRMPRMSDQELGEILDRGLAEIGLKIDPRARKRIPTLSRGLPHYTHLLGLHAARRAIDLGRKTVGPRDVDGAIERAIANAQQSILSDYLRAVFSPRRNIFAQALLACALAETDELGRFSAGDVRDPLSAIMKSRYEIPAFARHLNHFCGDRAGRILEQTGTARRYRYRFTNPLMQPYVVLRGIAEGLIRAAELG